MKPDNEEELMDIANDNDDLPMDSASPQQQQQNNSSAPGDGGGGVARENGDGNVSGGDEHMEDDESRSQATFSFVIHNFSRLKESVLSPPTYVRNLPWKIMAMPRTGGQNSNQIGLKSLGYFLQCNGDSESTSWSCNAAADLRILAQKEGCEHISRRISHIFYSKENDWGFSYFTSWAELTDPAKGFLVDDTLILEATVTADAPHGVSWDSKKHTGFVGLKNQGATCYMNSLLQTLYFTNKLRKAVYQMPTESDDSTKSVALALQRVFYDLQFSDKPVGTKKLTKSFGWETLDSFMQHDVQELCRVLLDNMESKMKGTCVEGTIPALFEGKMISFIRCKHVTFSSSRTEPFYDIQLNIKDKKDIYESFVEYVSTESLDGENKYDAGDLGMQEAEKGITFESFPPVLHLHLLRFQYDPATDANVKINDRYEFPEKLNLDKFLSAPEATPADYTLHAVLVHSGDNHGGHYVVFINPKGDGKWCKFDDDVVSCCHKEDAINNNYGGGGELPPEDTTPVKQSTNAYMLVYIRNSALSDVLVPVTKDDIQEQLIERLLEEKRQEVLRRKERNDAHLYFSVSVYTEDSLMTYKGTDLINPDRSPAFVVKVAKQGGYQEAVATVAEALKYPACSIRVWPFLARNNHSYRPTRVVSESDYALSFIDSPNGNPAVFVEVAPARVPPAVLPPSEKDVHVLIFFKYYDVKNGFLTYCGLGHVRRRARVAELLPLMCEKAGLPAGTPLKVYEEEYISCIHPITNFELTMEEAVNELMDGDIVAFERADVTAPADGPADILQFFNDLLHRVEVLFCDKTVPNDPGFLMELNLRMNYNQLAEAVALRLGTDPLKLQFFKNQSSYREGPGGPLKCNYEGTLKEILLYFKPRQPKKIYFQHLTISIHELENKRPFKCTYVNHKLKEEEFELFPNRSGTVADLLIEAAAKIDFSTAGEESTKQLRLLEILSSKINHIIPNDIILECLNPAGTKIYRVEEIPKDQLNLEPHEFLLPVAHFQKESYQTFGVPFLIKVKHNESFVTVKERIQKKLDVSDKEFEKYKFAIVSQRVSYITDEVGQIFRKEDHAINYSSSYSNSPKLWLGLDHVNKTPKRSRYSHYEKAIKIHN